MAAAVVIPVYNGVRYIEATLQSVAAQTLIPDEIVIVDDKSLDETIKVIEKISNELVIPVKLIRLERNYGGPAEPINIGIKHTSADVIAVLEQDDVMHPNRLADHVDTLQRYPDVGLVVGRRHIITSDSNTIPHIYSGTYNWDSAQDDVDPSWPEFEGKDFILETKSGFMRILESNFAHSNSNITFRRSGWERIGGFSYKWRRNCDIDFILRMSAMHSIALVNRISFGYRVHGDSLWHSSKRHGVIDGYKIRIEACLDRLEWATDAAIANLWALRREGFRALADREFRVAFETLIDWVKYQAVLRGGGWRQGRRTRKS